jgi:hypothetical protein
VLYYESESSYPQDSIDDEVVRLELRVITLSNKSSYVEIHPDDQWEDQTLRPVILDLFFKAASRGLAGSITEE